MPASPLTAPPGAPFHLLVKPTGAVCNLDCSYCFYLSKERLYPGSRFRMADELLEEYVSQLLEAQRGLPEVAVAWQGGEPTLMGVEFFRRSVELARAAAPPGQRVSFTLQTNGTLLDEEWAQLFAENEFLVGLSIDGPREMHDAYRVNKGGRGSFDDVMRGLRVLVEGGVEWNALTTVHAANAAHGRRVYRFLRDDCGARFVQLIPIVERDEATGGLSAHSVTGPQYGSFLVDVFEEWVRRDVGTVYVQLFDVTLANRVGEPSGLCVHSETCGRALALEHNGDVYSCDHFVEPRHLLGNIAKHRLLDLVDSEQQVRFGLAKRDTLPSVCRECDVRYACHGGCPKDRFAVSERGEPGLNVLCEGYKRFFRHVDQPMRIMAGLLAEGRAPAELTALVAAEDARRGRNDPCPCGSGAKWKRCHGT